MQKLKEIDEHERWKLDGTFKVFAKKTFILHMGRDPIGKTDAMTWVDFKNFRRTCHLLIEELERTIEAFALEERILKCNFKKNGNREAIYESSIFTTADTMI